MMITYHTNPEPVPKKQVFSRGNQECFGMPENIPYLPYFTGHTQPHLNKPRTDSGNPFQENTDESHISHLSHILCQYQT